MEENEKNEVVETTAAETTESSPVSQSDDGTIKVNLSELNKPIEDAVQEQETNAVDADQQAESSEEVVEEVPQQQKPVQAEESVIEEITEEEVEEQAEQLGNEVSEAIEEQRQSGIELPEGVQKVVDFMNETGGTLEDYVKLNQDYSSLNEDQLLREYYETTKPHLDASEINFLMEEKFQYDEDLDDERDIKKKKIARKEELVQAKSYLDGLKSKYYEEIKAGSRLNPEQQKAVEFFNRYNEDSKTSEQNQKTFLNKTEKLFNNDFKGFDYSVGDKKFRFKVKDVQGVKNTQSDINNFIKKFLNDKNEMSDASGYHKSLFTAMNADAIASHFYEQGKADAIKQSVSKSKNIDMAPRGSHEKTTMSNGWSIRAVPSDSQNASSFKIKKRR
jgi:hypothetical protein